MSDVAGGVPPWRCALHKLPKLEDARLEIVSVVCLWVFLREKSQKSKASNTSRSPEPLYSATKYSNAEETAGLPASCHPRQNRSGGTSGTARRGQLTRPSGAAEREKSSCEVWHRADIGWPPPPRDPEKRKLFDEVRADYYRQKEHDRKLGRSGRIYSEHKYHKFMKLKMAELANNGVSGAERMRMAATTWSNHALVYGHARMPSWEQWVTGLTCPCVRMS